MPAQKPVRRGQLISPFGVGALVDFPRDESLMTAGLDAWPFASEQCPPEWRIVEERLERRLGVRELRLPPDYRESGAARNLLYKHIPYVRFPGWHYCPARGVMDHLSPYGTRVRCQCRAGLDCSGRRRKPYLIPVRIVAVCERGHIQDFPFLRWLHGGVIPDGDHQLRLLPGRSSAALSGTLILCSCGQKKTLGGIFSFEEGKPSSLTRIGITCNGARPWLGQSGGDGEGACGLDLRIVQRGASNVYFPVVHSSIYLPLWAEDGDPRIVKLLEDPRIWETLSQGLIEGRRIDPTRAQTIAAMRGVDAVELLKMAQKRIDGATAPDPDSESEEEGYRRQEYQAFVDGRGGENSDLLVEVLDSSKYADPVSGFFSRICLVRKLRETRVLAGFTRLVPSSGSARDERVQTLRLDPRIKWLPAIVVRGEGILLEFDSGIVDEWLRDRVELERFDGLFEQYSRSREERGLESRPIDPRFMLVHTFGHALIRQMSFDCGYGSASLRERVYWEPRRAGEEMLGVLIYTASGDSEGTLGGLVRQGEPGRLEATIRRALDAATWCSSDPVCIESSGQGTDSVNLAACHGCVLVPETSCEEGNRLLDRYTLVGRPGYPDGGLFGSRESDA